MRDRILQDRAEISERETAEPTLVETGTYFEALHALYNSADEQTRAQWVTGATVWAGYNAVAADLFAGDALHLNPVYARVRTRVQAVARELTLFALPEGPDRNAKVAIKLVFTKYMFASAENTVLNFPREFLTVD